MPKGQNYSTTQLETLKSLWTEKGMRDVSSFFIPEACDKTKLSEIKVKRWIRNQQRKMRVSAPLRKKRSLVRPMNGYNLFCSSFRGQDPEFASFGKKWKELSAKEKKEWCDKAKTSTFLDDHSKQKSIQKHLKIMEKHFSSLQDLGCHAGGLCFHENTVFVLGSNAAKTYFSQEHLQNQFVLQACASADDRISSNKEAKDDVRDLRRRVTDIFNNKYSEAVGVPNVHFPYLHMMRDGVKVTGLPEDIQFRRPSAYGKKQLQEIIDGQNDIVMFLRRNEEESEQMVEVVLTENDTDHLLRSFEDAMHAF